MFVWLTILFLAAIVVAQFVAEYQDYLDAKHEREIIKTIVKRETSK